MPTVIEPDENNTAVDIAPKRFADEDLSRVQTWEDAIALLQEAGIDSTENFATDYGNGFTVLPTEQKSRLMSTPLMLLEWRFTQGDNGEFVSIQAVTQSGEKLIINDGSTGIRDQLKMVTKTRTERGVDVSRAHKGLQVPGGLRVSNYQYVDDKGATKNASTYYLAN